VKAVPKAHGIEEIFFPGELEDRNTVQLKEAGISLADTTWQSMVKLATETGTALPAANI